MMTDDRRNRFAALLCGAIIALSAASIAVTAHAQGVTGCTCIDSSTGKDVVIMGCACDAGECSKNCPQDGVCRCDPDITCTCASVKPGTAPASGSIEKLPAPALQVPIPQLQLSEAIVTSSDDTAMKKVDIPWIVQYLSGLYSWMVAIVGVLAAVMMMIGGFQYLSAGGDAGKVSRGKERITDAVTGLALTLGAYLLLNALNPDLVQFGVLSVDMLDREKFAGMTYVPAVQYTQITNSPVPTAADVNQLETNAAASFNGDNCLFKTIVGKESGGNPRAIGHDENVAWKGCSIGARCQFISSGKTYKGVTFENYIGTGKKKGSAYMNLVYNNNFIDDDASKNALDPSRPDFGLDLRFTHGIGLGQVTLLRSKGATTVGNTCPNGKPGRKAGSKCYDIADLLNPTTTMEATVAVYKEIAGRCGSDIYCGFYRYNGSGCAARGSACAKLKAYNKCKGIPTVGQPANCYAWDSALKAGTITTADCNNMSYQLGQ